MATAASSETTATATVVRATERQVRLKLGRDLGDREVTKRVAVPEEVRDTIEGAVVPIVVTGSGARAKVELAQGWAASIGDATKPAARKRTRGGKAQADASPAAAKKTRARGGRKAKEADASDAKKPADDGGQAAGKTAADAPQGRARKAQAKPAEGADTAPAERTRSRRKKPATTAVPAVSPAVVRKQIAAAVALVRGARS